MGANWRSETGVRIAEIVLDIWRNKSEYCKAPRPLFRSQNESGRKKMRLNIGNLGPIGT